MAKIQEEIIIITVSKLVKNDDVDSEQIVPDDTLQALNSVVEELLGSGVIVEVNKA